MKKLIPLALLLMVGCASPTIYNKPSGTTAEFNSTMATCQYQAMSNTPVGDPYGFRQRELIDLCLKSNGWMPEDA